MKTFISREYEAMKKNLQAIASGASNPLQWAEQSRKAVHESLLKLKDFIREYVYKDEDEEVYFFKELKPMFLKELLFYREVFQLEANKPVGDKRTLNEYYLQAQQRIDIFFSRNRYLYNYYQTGLTMYDKVFFLRSAEPVLLQQEQLPDIDPNFSTTYSADLSEIQAYELLNEFVLNRLYELEHDVLIGKASDVAAVSLPWTDNKTGLIEWLYGLHCMGSLNHAKVELRQIANLLETAFKVKLGNYARTFQEMSLRKKDKTPYLRRMIDMVEKRMEPGDY